MSAFVRRWVEWSAAEGASPAEMRPQTGIQAASKTSKRAFAGFAGSLEGHSEKSTAIPGRPSETAASDSQAEGQGFETGVEGMDLDQFAQAGLVVRVRSKVLGQQVLFVSDNVPEAQIRSQGLPVYRALELRKLALCRPPLGSLRRIHEVKTIFEGDVSDAQ